MKIILPGKSKDLIWSERRYIIYRKDNHLYMVIGECQTHCHAFLMPREKRGIRVLGGGYIEIREYEKEKTISLYGQSIDFGPFPFRKTLEIKETVGALKSYFKGDHNVSIEFIKPMEVHGKSKKY